jgi:hypothetical protein
MVVLGVVEITLLLIMALEIHRLLLHRKETPEVLAGPVGVLVAVVVLIKQASTVAVEVAVMAVTEKYQLLLVHPQLTQVGVGVLHGAARLVDQVVLVVEVRVTTLMNLVLVRLLMEPPI